MVTTKFIRLHSKCLAILEMIQQVNNRLSQHKADLYVFRHSPDPYAPIKLYNTESKFLANIAWDLKVKDRLVRYYANTVVDLSEDAIKKSFYNELKTA